MFGIGYLKAPATTYVIHYSGGKVVRQGAGLSFFYFAPSAVIAKLPISSVDVPFAFTEVTADFQDVTVQGNIIYKVADPQLLAGLLDYSVDSRGRYTSDDPSKLGERLVQTAQKGARTFIQTDKLTRVLTRSTELAESIAEALKISPTITQLGIEVLEVVVASLKADPEMAKALQSEARETLLKQADEAIYARRNASVELERTIRENELKTERVVAEKEREIKETEMEANIAIEQQRATLVKSQVENQRKEAEARGAALRAVLEPVREVDWRTLLAMQGNAESSLLISSAFEELARGAEKIGNLNISPELLESLLNREE